MSKVQFGYGKTLLFFREEDGIFSGFETSSMSRFLNLAAGALKFKEFLFMESHTKDQYPLLSDSGQSSDELCSLEGEGCLGEVVPVSQKFDCQEIACQGEGLPSLEMTTCEQLCEQACEQVVLEKISVQKILDQMEQSIEQSLAEAPTPDLKKFWDLRKQMTALLPRVEDPKEKAVLWSRALELSHEAKRIRDYLAEASQFAIEQITLALDALEKDVNRAEELLPLVSVAQEVKSCPILLKSKEFYEPLQKELQLLTTFGLRIQGLRKEILKTQMRVRDRIKLLERVSGLGDLVFPERKEKVQKISNQFTQDVNLFLQERFVGEEIVRHIPIFTIRDEIKTLQAVAKILVLSPHAFTEIRLLLSKAWDDLKKKEKEKKRESASRRQIFKENYEKMMEKIKTFAGECSAFALTHPQALQRSELLLEEMRSLELGREEQKELKEEIFRARKPLLDAAYERRELEKPERTKERSRHAPDAGKSHFEKNEAVAGAAAEAAALTLAKTEAQRKQKEEIALFSSKLQALIQRLGQMSLEEIVQERDDLLAESETLAVSRLEKQKIDRGFREVREVIGDLKEKALLEQNPELWSSFEYLTQTLEERRHRRLEVKKQIDVYRKNVQTSGLDFAKALLYQEILETERRSLQKVDEEIESLETRLELLLSQE